MSKELTMLAGRDTKSGCSGLAVACDCSRRDLGGTNLKAQFLLEGCASFRCDCDYSLSPPPLSLAADCLSK